MSYIDYRNRIPTYGQYDTVVLGGGPAGVCAAMASAREGKKTLLVEATGSLGGMATISLVAPLMTCYDRDGEERTVGGLFRAIIERLAKHSAVILPEETDAPSIHTSFIEKYHKHVTPIDSFMLQVVLDEMVAELGVEVMLYTRLVDCVTENGRIQYAVLSALEGLVAVEGKVFIDCTGNADMAERAGVATHKGDEESGVPQPGTLMFEVGGVVDEKYRQRPTQPVKAYRTPHKGRYNVNHYRVFGVDATDSRSMTAGHMKARRQVLDALAVLRNDAPGFENAEILSVAPVLGVRESRHIRGKYTITIDDIANGTKFDDRIAVYGFGMDVHPRNETMSGNFKIEVAKRYYIPYRALVADGCENLLVAGKTISCASQAAGGLRCMPCAMAMGEAAGIAASLAVDKNASPNEINVCELQKKLLGYNAIID